MAVETKGDDVVEHNFGLTPQQLDDINVDQMSEQNKERLEALGGVEAVAKALRVDLRRGLSSKDAADLELRSKVYGPNWYPEPPMDGWWALFFESFKDLTLIILCIAAVVSFVVGILEDPDKGWIDGVAILIAVLLVATVTATNDYQKERQFRSLNKVKEDIEISVLRDGEACTISVHDLVVGDVATLTNGDKVPADGIFISGDDLASNESSLTGEPNDLRKNTEKDPFLLSGCNITEGQGHMLCIAVGAASRWGRIKSKLATEAENTPLQDKLDTMAKNIGYLGGVSAALTLVAMLILWFVNPKPSFTTAGWIIHSFIIAVTIIVVAVPEGLPLAVTISLAFSTKKMLADQNLIRVMAACETMGNATNICSDKTGTLTENRMTVVECWCQGRHYRNGDMPSQPDLGDELVESLRVGLCTNSTAFLEYNPKTEKQDVRGSKTEGALIMFAMDLGADYKKERETVDLKKQYPFSSAKKMMSTLVNIPGGYRVYVKGASEYVLGRSTHVYGAGGIAPLDEEVSEELRGVILQMARGALRTIGVAHRDFTVDELPEDWEHNAPDSGELVFDCLCGIQDPLRSDVVEAVRTCQRAGIMVRMVTGDNIETAKAIAKQCGILTEGGEAMEGPDFRELTPEQLDAILPRLQVLARSSPSDKHTLVVRLNGVKLPRSEAQWVAEHPGSSWNTLRDRLLPGYRDEWETARGGSKAEGEVVGVTGDGTNDAPALKAADVGLSMGKTGTEVAKEASDIVILDDKFSSIKQAVLWGRSVYDNIRKFLQFQLTVNVVALVLTFLAAVLDYNPPLNPVMMLWVNLIMDTMGALALGTEAPTLDLLERRPYRRSAFLVSRPMARNILVQSFFQLVLLMILLIAGGAKQTSVQDPADLGACKFSVDTSVGLFADYGIIDGATACYSGEWKEVNAGSGDFSCVCKEKDHRHFTFIFNVFVWCQIFNEFNARRINDDWNVFRGLLTNWLFIGVIIVTVGLQLFIVEVGADFTKTEHLTPVLWLWSIGLGFVALPLGVLMRFIPVAENPKDFAGYSDPKNGLPESTTVPMPAGKRGGAIVVVPADERVPAAGSGGT